MSKESKSPFISSCDQSGSFAKPSKWEPSPTDLIGLAAIGGFLFVGGLICFWVWVGVQVLTP